ncbi:hypothetical protein [Streptomyces gobitricini]|uniref:Tripartite tricarboxylate transporter TctB family protein n=1 Tax=Streptomyces gobitricini TaxID=68211 RepID=A0ABP5YKQ8_9ACTN
MSVLSLEAVLGVMALVWVGLTREGPGGGGTAADRSVDDGGIGSFGFLVPLFLVALGLVLGAFLLFAVAVAVLPLAALSAWLGRRAPGREAWLWTPVVAAAVVGVTVVGCGFLAGGGRETMAWMWLVGIQR